MNNKYHNIIRNLPENPQKPILWVVYNEDMVEYAQNLIAEIKGKEYMKHIRVVSKNQTSKQVGTVYFDPMLMDHISNGSV